MTPDRDPIVTSALAFQKLSAEAFGSQRQRENDALEFQVPLKQWPADVQVQRSGQTVNGVAIPARPMLSIPSLQQPIQTIYNQWARAHYGVSIHPQSPDANDETAEVMQGIYRSIEVDSRAYIGRGWGFDRALKAGFGAYRVDVVYDDATDDPDDMKVVIKRILRQSSVYWDPFSVEPDFCDQTRNLIVSYISRAAFKKDHPKAKMADMTGEELLDMQSQMPNWARLNGDGKSESGQEKWYDGANDTVCVAEFFCTEYEEEPLEGSNRGTRRKPVIKWYKINAVEVLDTRTWNGRYIPVIPCIGNELQPFDTERRWMGIIEPNADAARLLNYEVSNAVETDALRPKAPFIGYVGQFKTNQAQWALANVRNLPYLEADPVMAGGQLAGLPQRNETSVDLSSSIALIQLAKESISTGTAIVDAASLENLAKRKVAHQTLAGLSDSNQSSQSSYLQNMADLTMTYEAKVVLDLIPKIYDRPGRVVRVLGENEDRREVMLNQPFIMHPKTKRPMAVPEGVNLMPPGGPSPKPKLYDLQKGTYGLVVDVGKSYQTRSQEGSDALGEIIKGIPETAPVLLPIWMQFQDFPGHKEAEKALKKMQPPQLQQPEDGEEPDAEMLMQQRDQAMQIADDLKAKLAEASKIIETDQAKQQATIEKANIDAKISLDKAHIDADVQVEKAKIQAETDLKVAGIRARADQEKQAAALAQADLDREDTQRFDHAESSVDRHHELTLKKVDHMQAAQERDHARDMAEMGHEQTLEQGEAAHEQAETSAERAAEREAEAADTEASE